ncbi:hypothetical protein PISL3812_00974 [Talaromyces islandicus]|uniref:ABM domain-containing protein n=1 Tax=Talaromyces islandicus TaxID=28573 RepID=A0A0U1LMV4_TALIS|nr:hypothetical protein PISL3812_00974 [Talaromyces islandicus]
MSSSGFIHVVESFAVKPDKLQEFFDAVDPVITRLEKSEPHIWHIYAVHSTSVDGPENVVLIAKYGLGLSAITRNGADKLFLERFFDEEAMKRVRGSPPFVEMSRKIEPLLEQPSEVQCGPVVLGFQDRQR